MKTYAVHDRDGNVLGMVTSATEGAPALVGAGDADLFVSEIEMDEALAKMSGPEAETRAGEVVRSLRIERRLARK